MANKKMKKGAKIFIILLFVAVLVAGVLISLRFFLNRDKSVQNLYTVNKEIYENVIEISGTVSAAEQQTLNALGDGTVMEVFVKKGDAVKKGDILVQLDDSDQVYNLEKHDYEMAKTKLTGSPRDLKLMETQRLALVQKIADRKIVASFDGIVVEMDAVEGNSVERGEKIGTLVNIDYLTAEVEVPETDVAKLEVGQTVILNFNASSTEGRGYVTGWPAIGELTSRGASIVKAQIRIDDYPPEILPNYSFTGKIQIEEPVENITVERYAIGYEDGKPYVVFAKNNEKKYVEVEPYGRNYVKILSGLKGGEVLLQSGEIPKSGAAAARNSQRQGSNSGSNRGNMSGGAMPPAGGFPGGGMPF